jgi:hypothetical protein
MWRGRPRPRKSSITTGPDPIVPQPESFTKNKRERILSVPFKPANQQN